MPGRTIGRRAGLLRFQDLPGTFGVVQATVEFLWLQSRLVDHRAQDAFRKWLIVFTDQDHAFRAAKTGVHPLLMGALSLFFVHLKTELSKHAGEFAVAYLPFVGAESHGTWSGGLRDGARDIGILFEALSIARPLAVVSQPIHEPYPVKFQKNSGSCLAPEKLLRFFKITGLGGRGHLFQVVLDHGVELFAYVLQRIPLSSNRKLEGISHIQVVSPPLQQAANMNTLLFHGYRRSLSPIQGQNATPPQRGCHHGIAFPDP